MFLLTIRRSGPQWDASRPMEEQSDWAAHAAFMDGLVDAGFIILGGPLSDEHRVVHAVEAESEDEIRTTLARDPWSGTHLQIDTIEPGRSGSMRDGNEPEPAGRVLLLGAKRPFRGLGADRDLLPQIPIPVAP